MGRCHRPSHNTCSAAALVFWFGSGMCSWLPTCCALICSCVSRMYMVRFFWVKLNWKMQSRSKLSVLQLLMDTVFRARLQQIGSRCSRCAFTAFAPTVGVVEVWVASSQHQLFRSMDPLAVHCTDLLMYTSVRTSKPCWQTDDLITGFCYFSTEVVMGSINKRDLLFVSPRSI